MEQHYDPRFVLKVEMKSLMLSEESKKEIQDTLRFVHGEEFVLKEQSTYKDRKMKLDRQYWVERGNLIVQASKSNANKNSRSCLPQEQVNQFAISKLEKYGFYPNHCREALRITNGDVGRSYELLMCRYFNLELPEPLHVPQNLLDERTQELDSLRIIYDNCCEEKIANQLWLFNLDLPYLGELYMEKRFSRASMLKKKQKSERDMCRFYIRGNCRFGSNCRFSHTPLVEEECSSIKLDENRNKFVLEVRFPYGSRYPLEPPLVSLTSKSENFPPITCLRITERLIRATKNTVKLEQPCVFLLLDLICNGREDILSVLQGKAPMFYDPSMLLLPQGNCDDELENVDANGEMFFSDGCDMKRQDSNLNYMERIDQDLIQRHNSLINDPKFGPVLSRRKKLPAWSKKEELLYSIDNNQVVIISGETGCGKSTQVPQFILDQWLSNQNSMHTEIVCTQPRRISAIGVAERVASERFERVGESVGYQIRLETRTSQYTRLTFCTTGILLRRLESDPLLRNVTHVVVDEVHERSVESDFLLLILKDLLQSRPELKVILMSATINSDIFKLYFKDVPVIEIPGRTFPVNQFFLEDVIQMTDYVLEEYSEFSRKIGKQQSKELELLEIVEDLSDVAIKGIPIPHPKTQDEYLPTKQLFHRYWKYSNVVCKTMFLMDQERINFELIETLLEWIVTGVHDFPRDGSILVFLPGLGEIKDMLSRLEANPIFSPNNREFLLIPLHSTLTNEEQALVFRKPRYGERKIVLSTNIAETSITIDDCVFVIDSGKMKEKGFDSNKNMESLETVSVSRANALQRKGRAGRVMPGVCFHLFSKHRFNIILAAQPVPEICRVPLEQLILKIKTLPNFDNKELFSVIGNLIEPPSKENVDGAVTRLRNVGALDDKSNLTPLGRHLASLPVDVRIGKLILYGAMFCALDSALTIAAFLSYKSPFVVPFNKKEEADARKRKFMTGYSDHLTTLNAYKGWLKACEKGRTRGGINFAKENYLSSRTLSTLSDMKLQFLELLADIGFIPVNSDISRRRNGGDRILEITGPELNANGNNHKLLSSILCASLYPNIVKVLTPDKQYQQSISGAIPQEIKADELVFKTKSDGYVHLHPTSVNSSVNLYPSPYLVFQEKIKTSKIFIRDCTMVPVLPLVLFSAGTLKVELNCGEFILSIDDGWIIFPVPSNEVAELLESIKSELLLLLDQKIKEPKMNLLKHPKGKKIISTIVHLVSSS